MPFTIRKSIPEMITISRRFITNYYQSPEGYVKVNIMKWNNGSEVGRQNSLAQNRQKPAFLLL